MTNKAPEIPAILFSVYLARQIFPCSFSWPVCFTEVCKELFTNYVSQKWGGDPPPLLVSQCQHLPDPPPHFVCWCQHLPSPLFSPRQSNQHMPCTLNLNDQKNTKKLQWFIKFTKLFRSVWKRSCFFSAVIICMSPSPLCQSMSPFARYFIPPLSANSSIYQTPSSPFGCWHKLWTHPKAQIRKQTAPSDFQGTQTVFRQGEELLIATNHADT